MRLSGQVCRFALATALVLVAETGCGAKSEFEPSYDAYRSNEIRGRVVDDTGKPLSGVAVAVTWSLSRAAGPDAVHDRLLTLADAVTDDDGEFRFAAWGPLRRPAGTWLERGEPTLRFFKADYSPVKSPNHNAEDGSVRTPTLPEPIQMRRFTGSTTLRAQVLSGIEEEIQWDFFRTGCDWERVPRYLSAIYDEIESIRHAGERGVPDPIAVWGESARAKGCRRLDEVFRGGS